MSETVGRFEVFKGILLSILLRSAKRRAPALSHSIKLEKSLQVHFMNSDRLVSDKRRKHKEGRPQKRRPKELLAEGGFKIRAMERRYFVNAVGA